MGMMDITFRQIRYFVCTAEMGQISQAAQELNITQSAITIAIKELESKLDVPLFIRTAKKMVLTEQGKTFLSSCYDMLDILKTTQYLKQNNEDISGELHVGATYTVLGYFLPAHIERLQTLYPKVKFNIVEMARAQIEQALLSGELDMAVLLSSNVNHPQLQVETFLESERSLWVSSDHPLLKKQAVDYADIATEPYIMLTVDEADMTAQKHWQEHHPVGPNVFMKTSSVEAVRSMVANGSGVCILSNAVYRPWSLEGKKINRIKLSSNVPTMNLGVAWNASKQRNQLQKIFADYFLNGLEH